MKSELKRIKKYYGEEMMHLCRELFPTILEEEGTLLAILESLFPHSRFLYYDIVKDNQVTQFKDFIYDKYNNSDILKDETDEFISPFDLMDQAGYTLYECFSEKDIQKFKKYYDKEEELCTFAGGRLDTSMVFFAVKKNVEDIKRENFPNPERQDEYGTSVISIQYRRGAKNTLSIKNRYNHTVENPDATFSNNLDNIIEGLNDSFERAYNLAYTGSRERFELSKYIRATDGRYYKFNYEVNGVYYGPDNIIIDNHELLKEYLEKEKYIIIDNIIIDLVNKRIFTHDNSDKYIESLNDIAKIEVVRIPDTTKKRITLIMSNGNMVIFEIDKFNRIISLYDECVTEIHDDALAHLECIKKISMPKAVKCGNRFLMNSAVLSELSMPEITYIGDSFLRYNMRLTELDLPKLKEIGSYFIRANDMIKELYLPSLETIGDNFMDLNRFIKIVQLPNVKSVGNYFLSMNSTISTLVMPKLEKVLGSFLYNNKSLKVVCLPNLISTGNCFLYDSMVTNISLPNLLVVGDRFMGQSIAIEEISLPNLIKAGDFFLSDSRVVNKIDLPNLVMVGDGFMKWNALVTKLNLPNLELCGDDFMMYNDKIEKINLPEIQSIGEGFLRYNYRFRQFVLKDMDEITTQNGKKYVRKR